MNTDSKRAGQHSAGEEAGRFCPTCRGPMLYTGQQRDTELGLREQERCSTCGFTAWKRMLRGADGPVRTRSY